MIYTYSGTYMGIVVIPCQQLLLQKRLVDDASSMVTILHECTGYHLIMGLRAKQFDEQ